MNAFRVLSVLATVVVSCSSSPDPLLATHGGALPHNLHHNPIGGQSIPVGPLHHAPAVAVTHAPTPFAFAHHATVPTLSVRHHGTAHVNAGYHVAAPVAVAHHAIAPVAVAAHHVPTNLAVPHHASHLAHGVPAVAVSHGVPAVAVSHAHATAPAFHVNSHHPVDHAASVQSQYRSQDESGQYSFGYKNGNSARDESRDAYGNVRGSYSYVDSYGKLQTQHYIADDYGFRVTGTNLPVQVSAGHGYRHKRSYATFPASTGPLTTVSHVAPVVHNVAHVHRVAPVIHRVAPVVHRVSHVHEVAPFVHKHSHVHEVAPLVHNVGPVVHAAPVGLGYAGIPQYGYNYHTGPSVSTYRSYDHPVLSHRHY